MPRFAANLSFLYPDLPFLDRFEAAASDGFKGVEFLFPYAWPVAELVARLRGNGLTQVLFNAPCGGANRAQAASAWDSGARGLLCTDAPEATFRASIQVALDDAHALSCTQVHVMAGLLPDGTLREALLERVAQRLAWACALAAQARVTLLIEPINLRDMPGYFLNRQDHAIEILDTVAAPNLRLQMDLYHCQVQEGDVATKLGRNFARIGHVQVAGVPDRTEPDQGELRTEFLFEQLDRLGYDGWVGCEYRPALGPAVGATHAGLGWLQRWSPRIKKEA